MTEVSGGGNCRLGLTLCRKSLGAHIDRVVQLSMNVIACFRQPFCTLLAGGEVPMKLVMHHSDWTLVVACFVILLFARPSSGQTRNQLAAKYKEVAAFENRPGVLAFSTFAKDGNVCRVSLERP